MSNFIFVIPSDWVSLDWTTITNSYIDMSQGNVLGWIGSNYYIVIEEILKNNNYIPQTSSIQEAVLFNDTVFAVRLG